MVEMVTQMMAHQGILTRKLALQKDFVEIVGLHRPQRRMRKTLEIANSLPSLPPLWNLRLTVLQTLVNKSA
jgi:hypothetical protein